MQATIAIFIMPWHVIIISFNINRQSYFRMHPWCKKCFFFLSLKSKPFGAFIFLIDGLVYNIESTILLCSFLQRAKLIFLSCVHFSITRFTPFSVTWLQKFNFSCKSPQQFLEITLSVSSSTFVLDKFNTSSLETSKFNPWKSTFYRKLSSNI
jgi:hypothetical protein